jgi:TolB-like protein/class 3 adenylate cyclase
MSPEGTDHRLAAILFTDVVGYTALMAESEQRGLAARRRHRELVGAFVGQFHGESIEARGDESLSVFQSALDAVNCALAIEDVLQTESDLQLHIGIHVGEIVSEGDEVSGDGVNIASRICALSEGGGICVSGEVYRAIRNHPEIEATPRGEQDLKNVGQPIVVYSIARRAGAAEAVPELEERGTERSNSAPTIVLGAAAASVALLVALAAWFWTGQPEPLGPIRSIAVLPLDNLSGDPEQRYFALGMTEELIGALSKIRSLRVISWTSAKTYENSSKRVGEIAGELGVDAIIEGTVRREEDRVRITTQLIDARSDDHIWSDRYERDVGASFALQNEIAQTVAREIRLALTPAEQVQLAKRVTTSSEAHDAYLRGRHELGKFAPDSLDAALRHFDRAIDLDATLALAYAGRSNTLFLKTFLGGVKPHDMMTQAKDAAVQALGLDDDLAGAHAALAVVSVYYDWDWDTAETEFQRAQSLGGGDPVLVDAPYAYFLGALGREEEALEVIESAIVRAPRDILVRFYAAHIFLTIGLHERGLSELVSITEIDPSYLGGHTTIAMVREFMGDFENAVPARMRYWELLGRPDFAESLRRSFESGGVDGYFEAQLSDIREFAQVTPIPPWYSASNWWVAYLLAYLGRIDEAFQYLDRALDERESEVVSLRKHVFFPKPLRSDPRYADLIRRVGLPE